MIELSSFADIERLYAERGGLSYGEGVSQTEHALQCAVLAEAEGAPPSLVAAAFLHDIGHLLEDETRVAGFTTDDHHELAGVQALSALFGPEVCGPIALHVAAKRYLCLKEADYFDALSAASKASLKLQGGPFDARQAAAFEHQPYWLEALTLRRFDDMGKRDEAADRSLADFAPLIRSLLIDPSRS